MGWVVGGIIFGVIVLVAVIGLSKGSKNIAEDASRMDRTGRPIDYHWHDPTL